MPFAALSEQVREAPPIETGMTADVTGIGGITILLGDPPMEPGGVIGVLVTIASGADCVSALESGLF